MFTTSWDKMIRVIDIGKQTTIKSLVASKEIIKEMVIINEGENSTVIVAGCEPIIRAYNIETGT